MKTFSHRILITVQCDDAQGSTQAADRIHQWLETFGHTSVSHGFEFQSTTPVPVIGKRIRRKKRKSTKLTKGELAALETLVEEK